MKDQLSAVDRNILSTVASYKESNSSSSGGGGIYSVAMPTYLGGIGGQQSGLGGGTGIVGTGAVRTRGGGGQPGGSCSIKHLQ